MSGRGRRATPPPPTFHAEEPLAPSGLLVSVANKAGLHTVFDFSGLEVAEPMQRSFAVVFARQSRGWTAHTTAKRHFDAVVTFSRFLAAQEDPAEDFDTLSAATLKRWRAKNIGTNTGKHTMRTVRTLLERDPRLTTGPAAEELARRIPGPTPSKQSFAEAEREQVILTAQRQFRSALLRIRENVEVLEKWRAGELPERTRQWRLGEVLDHLARHGNVRRTVSISGNAGVTNKRIFGGTSPLQTWGRLFLTRSELTALAVLLTDRFGWNLSLYDRMPAPNTVPSAGESWAVTYQVMIEKRRGNGGRWYSTENVTDSGADSAGRLITQALEATAPARQLAAMLAPGTDLLMVARTAQPSRPPIQNLDRPPRVGSLVFGVDKGDGKLWALKHGLGGSPFQRTRRTTVTREGRPLQHTQTTHESVYVLPDKRVQQAAQKVFEEGALEALQQAKKVVFGGQISQEEPDPAHQQTVTADCSDEDSSPWPAPGGGCRADFLLCLACRNAHVHPGHHPRLAHLHEQLGSLRSALPDHAWTNRWRDHLLRLEDLRDKVGPLAWNAALSRVSDNDRALVQLLLKGGLAS